MGNVTSLCRSKYSESGTSVDDAGVSTLPAEKSIHEGSIFGLSEGKSGSEVVSCGEDKCIMVYDWDSPSKQLCFRGHTKPVNKVKLLSLFSMHSAKAKLDLLSSKNR